jgi:basic membrane protein A
MLSACSNGSTTKQAIKICLAADTGGLNDKSFNQLANDGLLKAEHDFGVPAVVKVAKTGDDYVPNLNDFATQGCGLIVAVGFLIQPAVGQVSQSFPNIHFAVVDGGATDANFNPVTRANVQSLLFKEEEAGALVGVIAGMLEKDGLTPKKTNTVSTVGGQKIPPVDHYIAGFQWGAAQEVPNIKLLNTYSNDFSDSAKCRDIANQQISAGSEIIFQVAGGCGNGALQAAGQNKVYSIGVDNDQKDVDPSVIASALKHVDVAVYNAIKAANNGQFQAGETRFSLANDGVGYAQDNITLPADVTAEVTRVEGLIKAGSVTIPNTVP